jgi:hypothetical protein
MGHLLSLNLPGHLLDPYNHKFRLL